MLTAISTGLKMDVPRTFLFLLFSFVIMSFYAGFIYISTESVSRIVLYIPAFIYVFHYLKAFKLYQEFKIILNESTSMNEFDDACEAYVNRADYIKLRRGTVFLLGWATVDVVKLVMAALN